MPRYRKRGRGRALAAVPDDVRASIVAWVEWDDWDTICAVRAASSAFRNAVDGHIRCVLTRDAILPITSPVPAFFVDIAADLVTRPVCLGSRQTLRALFAKFYRVGHLEAVRACIDAPHSVDAVCFDQVLTLCDRFGTNRCLDVVQAWIRTTKRLRRDALSDALGSASMRCQWDLVRLLIEQGAVVNGREHARACPLAPCSPSGCRVQQRGADLGELVRQLGRRPAADRQRRRGVQLQQQGAGQR